MSLIQVSDLTFAYDTSGDLVFDHVSFRFDTDWKLGFTGRNGRGKTTFLKLLQKEYEYGGTISSSVEFDCFPYPVKDRGQLTLDVVEEINPLYEYWQLQRELSLLEVEEETLYRPIGTLSNGERTKILLAALFLKENQYLLIDEPTNHLDSRARERVAHYLNRKNGFLLVSHDRAFLDQCTDHILALNRSGVEVRKGNFSSWFADRERQEESERAENERLKKEIRRMTAAARQSGNWAEEAESKKIGHGSVIDGKFIGTRAYLGEKSRRMQQRRKNLERRQEKAIREKSELLQNAETADDLRLEPLQHYSPRLAAMQEIVIRYGDRELFQPVNLEIRSGERISLQGRNGSGKTSILRLLLGEELEYKGNLQTAAGLKISYVSQDTSDLRGDLSAYAASYGIQESLLKAVLRKLDFSRTQFAKQMEEFSEGQKKKVLIARSLCEKAHLYVWDEPLNYIDVFSRMQIEKLILTFQPTMLFVEHDREFVRKTADRSVEIKMSV